jgi:hypothetical protein
MPEYVVSLTTIPSKFQHLHHTMDSLIQQTLPPSKIVINLPKQYHFRLKGEISDEDVAAFLKPYAAFPCVVNRTEDFGPGTKLLGVLKSNLLEGMDPSDTYLVLVDDDLIYKPQMLEWLDQAVKNKTEVGSFWVYPFHELRVGQGADAFLMRLSLMDSFLDYYDRIKAQDYVNYHDDFYISFYFQRMKKQIEHVKTPSDCSIYEMHPHTYTDALCKLQDKYSRPNVNHHTYAILTDLHQRGLL